MLANSVGLAIAYLAFGLVLSVLARKGWAQDWDEGLLASLLGPPLFTLIALTCLGGLHLEPHRSRQSTLRQPPGLVAEPATGVESTS